MRYLIASYTIFILSNIPLPVHGQDIDNMLVKYGEYDLLKIELYERQLQADETSKDSLLAIIAYLHQLDGLHRDAVNIYSQIIYKNTLLTASYVDSLKSNLCFSLLELGQFGRAYSTLNEIDSIIAIPVKMRFNILTTETDMSLAREIFSPVEQKRMHAHLESLRSPQKAKFLSFIIPGLGQFYSKHYVDALQSAIVVGAGIIYSAVSINSFNQGDIGPILPIVTTATTSLFYYANILSGYRTAIYRNMKLKREYLNELELNKPPYDLV